MIVSLSIVNHHPLLIKYIDKLQRENAESLAFLPRSAFEREELKDRLFLGLYNNEPCGYIYLGALKEDVKLHQVCIQYDLRRKLYGAELVGTVESVAIKAGARTITLRCGFDLEANTFWDSLGYHCIGVVEGGVRRQRKINIWRKYLMGEPTDILVSPSRGVTSARLWSKTHSKDNPQSQFIRGRKLLDYRERLEKIET